MSTGVRVMVVEDEVLVRMEMVEALEDAGFDVAEAGNAVEALQKLAENPGIELVFSDVDMPGAVDGLDLAEMVARQWPWIRVLLTSGRPGREVRARSTCPFFPKPYWPGDVISAMRAHRA